jgi:hypothetical protein
MRRARRVRMLVTKARELIERSGDRTEALQAMQEAIDLLRHIEDDMTRFLDAIATHVEELQRED